MSNSPVTDVTSTAIRCNAGTSPAAFKCAVSPGSTVTVEMHQQSNDRSCANEAIGGAHYGPVSVYLSKVDDASTADGSSDWFKVFEDGWKASGSGNGDADYWGTKDLNTCCGKLDVPIPASLAAGDYLLRAEALALHSAASAGGAQFYMTCFQLQVGGGTATRSSSKARAVSGARAADYETVKFPGAYKASDPGIQINIYTKLSTYVVPGPTVIPGGTTRVAGSACAGCESTCTAGSSPSGTAVPVPPPAGGGSSGCTVAQYQQCGGTGFTGCTNCAVSHRIFAMRRTYANRASLASRARQSLLRTIRSALNGHVLCDESTTSIKATPVVHSSIIKTVVLQTSSDMMMCSIIRPGG